MDDLLTGLFSQPYAFGVEHSGTNVHYLRLDITGIVADPEGAKALIDWVATNPAAVQDMLSQPMPEPESEDWPPRAEHEPRPGWIYVLRAAAYCKIGKTSRPDRRLLQLGIQLPFPAELVCAMPVSDVNIAESYVHGHFANKRTNGEWFALTQADIDAIPDLLGAFQP